MENLKCEESDPASVIIHLQPAGNAPRLSKKKFKINSKREFRAIEDFLRRALKKTEEEDVFLYLRQCFEPDSDQVIGDLYACFGTGPELQIWYATQQVWG
ncbi:MAG: hypothetical protein MHM6MM_004409 [Cercozoa sp. M6MM]